MKKIAIPVLVFAVALVAVLLIAAGVRAQTYNYGPSNASVSATPSNNTTNITGTGTSSSGGTTTTTKSTTTTPGLPNTGGGGAALER